MAQSQTKKSKLSVGGDDHTTARNHNEKMPRLLLQQKEGMGHGTSHRILRPAEFQAEAAVGASGSARQSSRVPAAGSQKVCLIRSGSKTMRIVHQLDTFARN